MQSKIPSRTFEHLREHERTWAREVKIFPSEKCRKKFDADDDKQSVGYFGWNEKRREDEKEEGYSLARCPIWDCLELACGSPRIILSWFKFG